VPAGLLVKRICPGLTTHTAGDLAVQKGFALGAVGIIQQGEKPGILADAAGLLLRRSTM